jgi:hypothetical protein
VHLVASEAKDVDNSVELSSGLFDGSRMLFGNREKL